jgi:serine/threonine protein kinase
LPHDPRIGTVIGGYRIEAGIGRGGMGVVYRAEQLRLGRRVALKLIAPELAEDPEFRERFERESRIAASIEHPNVIPVHEAGESDGVLFIVMRYVDGTDLRALLRDYGRLEPSRAAELVSQVAAALDAAHAYGLVHRDVKPANVLIALVGGREHAYLTDFGLTKHLSSQGGMTKTGEVVGTIDYLAPEQIEGRPLDARTDVYALGCVLHQAVTGQVPYVRDSDVAKMYAHLSEPPPSPTGVVAGLPPELDEVIARGMAKNPETRYPSAGDLGRAAQAAARRRAPAEPERSVAKGEAAPVTALAAAPPTAQALPPTHRAAAPPQYQAPAPPPPPAYNTSATHALPARRRGRSLAIGVAAAVLGAGILAGGLFAAGVFESDTSKPTAQTTTVGGQSTASESNGGSDGGKTVTSASDYTTYSTDGYRAEYPADWRLAEDHVLKTTYSRTRFVAPDGSEVWIDHSPGQDADPDDSARKVEPETAKTSGYRRLSFESTTLNGRDAFEWTFQIGSERRIDIFMTAGGHGFAVLGKGSDFASVIGVARHVAGSIQASSTP